MLHRRIFPREELEEMSRYLAQKYPAAFFAEPALKRPLKKNILADLERDNTLDSDKREAAVTFYTQDWNYENTLQAGAERVGLDGKRAGTVTEQEQLEAQKRIWTRKQELKGRDKALPGPIEVVRKLHSEGRVRPTASANLRTTDHESTVAHENQTENFHHRTRAFARSARQGRKPFAGGGRGSPDRSRDHHVQVLVAEATTLITSLGR